MPTLVAHLNASSLLGSQEDPRLIADLKGRYFLAKWANADKPPSAPHCRAQRITSTSLTFIGLGGGEKGDEVVVNLEQLGRLTGRIRRAIGSVFWVDLEMPEEQRQRFAGKIRWLQRQMVLGAAENRKSQRFKPENPASRILVASGDFYDCYLIDISTTGAAVAADLLPEVGTVLAIGRVVSRVVRHTDSGFAVKFVEPQERELVELMVGVQDFAFL